MHSRSKSGINSEAGCVYLVGAGPGDPDLLTRKAERLIRQAEVLVYDRLVAPEILALAPTEAIRVDVGKRAGTHPVPQSEINELLLNFALAGHNVVRLKGGDPYTFGRGSEEAEHLARNAVAFEVVPGVTSASACAAAIGVPLTHRGLATGVRYLTGHCRVDHPLEYDWKGLADGNTTLVIYMGLANIGQIAERLIQAGRDAATPVAAIAAGSTPRQRQIESRLDRIANDVQQISAVGPVLFIIGQVVTMRSRLRAKAQEKVPVDAQAS